MTNQRFIIRNTHTAEGPVSVDTVVPGNFAELPIGTRIEITEPGTKAGYLAICNAVGGEVRISIPGTPVGDIYIKTGPDTWTAEGPESCDACDADFTCV